MRADGEEDAPRQESPSDQQDAISSSKNESSGVDSSPPYDCPDIGCTWPCAHHFHWRKQPWFFWYPDLDHFGYQHPEMPRIWSEMKVGAKDCQFCGIFFTIWQSGCACGENGHNDHAMKSNGFRSKFVECAFRSNGQLSQVHMIWTCGPAFYELGLPTGKMVWSLYDLSKESFLTLASSRQRPTTPAISHT